MTEKEVENAFFQAGRAWRTSCEVLQGWGRELAHQAADMMFDVAAEFRYGGVTSAVELAKDEAEALILAALADEAVHSSGLCRMAITRTTAALVKTWLLEAEPPRVESQDGEPS